MKFFKDFWTRDRDGTGIVPWLLVCAALLFSFVSISAVQIFLAAALLAWAARLVLGREKSPWPPFFWPLLVYAALSLAASAFSVDPATSFRDCRDLLLILVIPLTALSFKEITRARLGVLCLAASALVSCAYSLSPFVRGAWPGGRVTGFMSHTMTQGGLLMLFSVLALSLLFFLEKKAAWPWAAVLAPALACLALTLTRSAWVGLAAAVLLLVGISKPKLLVLPPLLVLLFFVVSKPLAKRISLVGEIRERASSIFSLKDPSNRDRLEYLRAGWKVIRLRPLLGTGPDTVDEVFTDPSLALSAHAARNVHLHNNLIQIAAERGLAAAAAWLVFLVTAFLSALRIRRRAGPWPKALAAAAMGAAVALFFAGFFEYNFGDSEITVLFFVLLSLPHGLAARSRTGLPSSDPSGAR